jgi:hypothetical protein
MASLVGTTWQFVPSNPGQFLTFNATFNSGGTMTAIISSIPWAPGNVINFTGTWNEGQRKVSFTFNLTSSAGDIIGSGAHGIPQGPPGNGGGTLTVDLASGQSFPNLQFQMMKVSS